MNTEVKQHTILETVFRHLLPGAFISIAFVLLGLRRNNKISLEGIVLNRTPLSKKEYLLLISFLFLWSAMVFTLLHNFDLVILSKFFYWLQDWFQVSQINPDDYSLSILSVTFLLFLFLNGILGPVVEGPGFSEFLAAAHGILEGLGTAGQCPTFLPLPFLFSMANFHTIAGILPFGLLYAAETKPLHRHGGPLPFKCWFLFARCASVH